MDSSAPTPHSDTEPTTAPPGASPNDRAASPVASARKPPDRLQALCLMASADLQAVARSWLCRGFFLASALLTLLQLKAMQAEEKAASSMLEAVYGTYLLVWMHGVIFIAGGALSREADCLNDAILSRGATRGEYLGGKLAARCGAVLLMLGLVLIPSGFWAIRQDELVRTETGFATSAARNARVEAWNPKKLFARTHGAISEVRVDVGDEVQAGDPVALLDDRELFDQLENARRAEEDALNQITDAQRRHEDARRAVAQAEDSLDRAERALTGKDLLSRLEQADRETEVRSRKRELKTAETQLRSAEDAIAVAERTVESRRAQVREARERLGYASIIAPISGHVTERHIEAAQPVALVTHLLPVAPLDFYQIDVPVYQFKEFKRLEPGLKAFITIDDTEFEGAIERLGAMTRQDRWGRECNYAVVRFQGRGVAGLLGQEADVRLLLPPQAKSRGRVTELFDTLTGRGEDDVETRTASVTTFWMFIAAGKVLGCALLLTTLSLLLAVLTRNALFTILAVAGLWHVSNLLFEFVGLPDLSYLEMLKNLDKVLGGATEPVTELKALAWLATLSAACAFSATTLFIARDPPK